MICIYFTELESSDNTSMYLGIHTHTRASAHTHTHTYTHTYIYTYIHTYTSIHIHTNTHTHTHTHTHSVNFYHHSNETLFYFQEWIYPWIQVIHPCGMDRHRPYHYAASIYDPMFCTTLRNGSSDHAAGNSISVTPSYHKWPPSTDLSFCQWDMMGRERGSKV